MTCGINRTIRAETDLIVPNRMLKKSVSCLGARRARLARQARRASPDSGCLAFPASPACLARRPCGELHWFELPDELTKDLR